MRKRLNIFHPEKKKKGQTMDERIDEIMSFATPLIEAEFDDRVAEYLKGLPDYEADPKAEALIAKLVAARVEEVIGEIRGSIETELDLSQAGLEGDIEVELWNEIYPGTPDLVEMDGWSSEDLDDVDWNTEQPCASCPEIHENVLTEKQLEGIPEGVQTYSLDLDWDDIQTKECE
jgi:hypothetical protein